MCVCVRVCILYIYYIYILIWKQLVEDRRKWMPRGLDQERPIYLLSQVSLGQNCSKTHSKYSKFKP